MRGRESVMLVMAVIKDLLILVTVISIPAIVACAVSISVHVRMFATAYTVKHLRSITATCTCIVAT